MKTVDKFSAFLSRTKERALLVRELKEYFLPRGWCFDEDGRYSQEGMESLCGTLCHPKHHDVESIHWYTYIRCTEREEIVVSVGDWLMRIPYDRDAREIIKIVEERLLITELEML